MKEFGLFPSVLKKKEGEKRTFICLYACIYTGLFLFVCLSACGYIMCMCEGLCVWLAVSLILLTGSFYSITNDNISCKNGRTCLVSLSVLPTLFS